MPSDPIRFSAEVSAALRNGAPVVALESTIISHGLPRPDNLSVALEIEQTVRANGAVPATIGMLGGQLVVGLAQAEIEHLAMADSVVKLSARDLAPASVRAVDGATTVSATAAIAARAGIALFATGGLGGVHRGAATSYDESADLVTLASTQIMVICSGVKSILDVPATLERLETLGVAVIGYGTDRFPGFYLADSGLPVPWRADSPDELAGILRAATAHSVHPGAILVGRPLPESEQLDPALHDRVLADALAKLVEDGVTGKDVTPYLLSHFHQATEGASLAANIRIILGNAALAAQVAAGYAGQLARG